MSLKLPIIVSVPHGGDSFAPELTEHTMISHADIFSDGDPLTRDIYDFRREAAFYFDSSIARAAIDLNRSPEDLPPAYRDGVVKSHTVTGKGIYRKNGVPVRDTLRLLLRKYHTPYHNRLGRASRTPNLFCGIDCHTMLDRAPVISDHPGRRRPFICLSNRGDHEGNRARGRRLTCPPEMIRSLAFFLREQFPGEADAITLNDPFLGGYIIRRHSRTLPWIQVELNRRAYLDPRWFNQRSLMVCRDRLAHLQSRLLTALRNFIAHNHVSRNTEAEVA